MRQHAKRQTNSGLANERLKAWDPTRLVPPLRGLQALTSVVALTFCGCSAEPAAAPAQSGSQNASVADPSATTTDDAAGSPATGSAQSPGPGAAESPAAKPTAPPSPEQIAKWAVTSFEPLELLACYDGFGDTFVNCLALAPDGKQFVLGGVKLTLWNVADSKPSLDLLAEIKSDQVERPILSVGISPDGQLLAAGDSSGRLLIWKLSDLGEPLTIAAHDGRLTELAFSPDSKTLATTSYGGEVRLWQLPDGKKLKSIKADSQEIHGLVFLSDTLLATAGRAATIWNIESGKQTETLTKGNVIRPALGLSADRHWLVFNDGDSQSKYWDIEKGAATELSLPGVSPLFEFSPDGKWIATYAGDATIRIWDAATRSVVQVINAHGGSTPALKWLPESGALLIASEGRVRLWGTPAAAKALGVEPLEQPKLRPVVAAAKRSYSPTQFDKVIDVRSFPRLPHAEPSFSYSGLESYNTPAKQPEAEQFYRYYLGKTGWQEIPGANPTQPGLNFRKDGCALNISFSPASSTTPGRESDLQVNLQFHGNYDARWLPKISALNAKGSFAAFSNVTYRAKATLTDLEVALLKQFHKAGWTPYTRLNSSGTEDPRSRSFSMVQGGSVLTVSIGYPADSTDELFVQTSVNLSHKALPIPPDSGWIEFDSSTDLMMVANTKMNMDETIAFYDKEMALDGWIAREAGRKIEDQENEDHEKRSWLPYIRGQQDVLIRLVTLPTGGTRIIVGEAERSSWQLQPPKTAEAETESVGIEAADFPLPKGATAVRFDVDEKKIEFELANLSATKLAEQFIKQMEALKWERDGAGIVGDDYSFITYKQGRTEIQLRARGGAGKPTTAMISGDGLLWTKSLPTAAERISYETWLRRNHKPATLDLLDEFAAEMRKIPANGGKGK